MASRREPPKSAQPARESAPTDVPVGAQADPNSVSEAASSKSARAREERAAQTSQNSIQASASPRKLTAPRADVPTPTEERADASVNSHAMPEHIHSRYMKVGDDYHFADGNLAFRDAGNRLSTQLENAEVVRDLIAIAQARDWSIEISGSKAFRRLAWQEAQLAGLTVRNYEPSDLERQQLARRMGRDRDRPRSPDTRTTEPTSDPQMSGRTDPVPQSEPNTAAREVPTQDRVYRGRLIDHGVARYQFDPRNEEDSYYVILETPNGEQAIWGKDLQRAVEQSLSNVQEGQDVAVRQWGAKPVTVRRPVLDADGRIVDHTEVKTHLNRWSIESEAFLNERARLAEVVRDVGIDAKSAVAKHPELVGTYGELHAARLVALQQNYRSAADVDRFINRTREAIAQEIERGEALSPPLTRARYVNASSKTPREQQRAQERVL